MKFKLNPRKPYIKFPALSPTRAPTERRLYDACPFTSSLFTLHPVKDRLSPTSGLETSKKIRIKLDLYREINLKI